MKILIKLDDEIYKDIKARITADVNASSNTETRSITQRESDALCDAVLNGTTLSDKAKLVDINECDRKLFYAQAGGGRSMITVKSAFDMLEALPEISENIDHDA